MPEVPDLPAVPLGGGSDMGPGGGDDGWVLRWVLLCVCDNEWTGQVVSRELMGRISAFEKRECV